MLKKIRFLSILSCLLAVFLMVTGCQQDSKDNRETSQKNNYDLTLVNNKKGIDQTPSNKAKQLALKNKAVKGSRAVNLKKDLLLALEVKQINRFQLNKIEKETKSKLEKEFPNMTIDVSTDRKLFLEIDKLEQDIQNNKLNTEQIDKRYKKIKKLINDQA